MKDNVRCVKIVEWSDEDQCFVGSCPGLFYGGCHGQSQQSVFADETIELYKQDGKSLPSPTSGEDYANRMQAV